MNLLAVSINHHTAPVEIRENLHLDADEIKQFIGELKGNIFTEGLIVSTCNRTELYGFPINPSASYTDIQQFIIDHKPIKSLASKHFQNFFSCGAVHHLFKVSSGIESQLIGDNQILGQVKEAFQLSEDQNFAGFLMKRVFDSAIKVGKRAKTETEISEGAITVSYAAVQLIEKIFAHLNKKSALVIGAGETGEIAAKHLKDKNIGMLAITNRTLEKAEKVAENVHSTILPFQYFKDYLHEYDIVISATSSPNLILTRDEIKAAMKKRNFASTIFMDIAVPRDIDPTIRDIDNVFYHDIDSLKIIVDQNLKRRQTEIPKVRQIILEEMVSLFSWYNSLEVTPTIKSLRDLFETIRAEEVDRMKHKLSPAELEQIDIVTKRILNKLLHHPTVELKKLSENGTQTLDSALQMSILRNLFGLNTNESNNGKDRD